MLTLRLSTLCVAAMLAIFSAPAGANGFATTSTLPFKLSAAGMGVAREQLHQSVNSAGSGTGSATAQTQTNMNNVVQITQDYNIVLNGSNNTVNTTGGSGGYSGGQTTTGTSQTTDNQIYNQSKLSTLTGNSGNFVLNP